MKNNKTTWILSMIAAAAMVAFAPTAAAAEQVLEAKAIEKMSEQAATPKQHAEVAKHYRLRAESLEAKAVKHEEAARKMAAQTGPANPMNAKWPSMVRNNSERENRLALEARRAAQECYARADRHIRLAVEGNLAAE